MNGFAQNPNFIYVYDVTLTPSQRLEDSKKTDTDSDFLLLGMLLNAFTSILFSLWFRDASGNYFSSDPVLAATYAAQGPIPYVFQGEPRVFPPGSQIRIDSAELSAAQNTIQLGFIGVKRFTSPPSLCGTDYDRYAIAS